jgi:hypothetical protein
LSRAAHIGIQHRNLDLCAAGFLASTASHCSQKCGLRRHGPRPIRRIAGAVKPSNPTQHSRQRSPAVGDSIIYGLCAQQAASTTGFGRFSMGHQILHGIVGPYDSRGEGWLVSFTFLGASALLIAQIARVCAEARVFASPDLTIFSSK